MSQKLLGVFSRRNGSLCSTIVLIERVSGDPTAHHHHRHAGSWMGCPSRQVQPLQIGTDIGRLKSSVPTAVAGDSVNCSIQHLVSMVNINRRERTLKDDPLFNISQARGALELVENHLAIGGKHLCPVMLRTQKRRVHQHVERITAHRRGGWIGDRSGGEITGRVRRRIGEIVDVVKLLVRIAGKDKIMMRQMLVALIKAEIKHHTGTSRLVFSPFVEAIGNSAAQQFAISAHRVFIRDYGVEAMLLPIACLEP